MHFILGKITYFENYCDAILVHFFKKSNLLSINIIVIYYRIREKAQLPRMNVGFAMPKLTKEMLCLQILVWSSGKQKPIYSFINYL